MRAFLASVLALAATAAAADAANGTCAKGLYLIVARGSSEPQGLGITGELADRVADDIKGSAVEALDYPATISDPTYSVSEGDGVEALQLAVRNYTGRCPDSKLAIMGYSQGAQLTMDALCGSASSAFEKSSPLPADLVKKNIVAVVLFGDPTHVANTTFDKGTSVNNGVFDRNNTSIKLCETYADRLVSYCDKGKDRLVHSSYIVRYSDAALKFVTERYAAASNSTNEGGGGGGDDDDKSGSPSSSSTSSASPTNSRAPTASTAGSRSTSTATSAATSPAATAAAPRLASDCGLGLLLLLAVAAAALQAL